MMDAFEGGMYIENMVYDRERAELPYGPINGKQCTYGVEK